MEGGGGGRRIVEGGGRSMNVNKQGWWEAGMQARVVEEA